MTVSIIAVNCAVLIGQWMLGQTASSEATRGFFQRFGFVPANFLSFGLLSSIFLHGGLLHLLSNMFFLWLFGDNVEDRFSRAGYLLFYLSCGVVANIFHGLLNWGSDIPVVGASGAISGVIGAYLAFHPTARIKTLVVHRVLYMPAFVYFGGWFLLQLLFGVLTRLTGGVAGVAWWAHIGGYIFGGVLGAISHNIAIVHGKAEAV